MRYLSILLIICASLNLSAHTSFCADKNPDDTVPKPAQQVSMTFSDNVDSLLNLWFLQQYSPENDSGFVVTEFTDSIIPDFPDSVYIQRLRDLNSCIPLSFNRVVRNYINLYTQKKRELVENMLGIQDYYLPVFEEILDANQMPLELKYMPVIESALNPNAVSRAGATGIWQFMYGTGKLYKLEINSWVDDRRDPLKASLAAVNFMKDLYAIYQDWILVVAAYNCGPGSVNKAIRRSHGKKDYWEIYYHLPRETRGYIPAFIAANYVMNYYPEHKLVPRKPENLPVFCDTIHIHEQLHLKQVSEVLNIPMEVIHKLNPQYRRDVIPGVNGKSYVLRLPADQVNRYIDLEDSILNYKDSIFFDPAILSRTPSRYSDYIPNPPTKDHAKVFYTVKQGDNLGYIAQWFNVSLADLKYWNKIRRNIIHEGRQLVIYIPKAKASYYREFDKMSFDDKRKATGKPVVVPANTAKNTIQPDTIDDGYIYYTVKSGDTIWGIAQKYEGVTNHDIMQLNGLMSARSIYPGQKLRIKRKA